MGVFYIACVIFGVLLFVGRLQSTNKRKSVDGGDVSMLVAIVFLVAFGINGLFLN